MMSNNDHEERENHMQKSLLIAHAICLLLLGGCGSAAGTGASSSAPPSQKTGAVAPTDPQVTCRVLHAQEAQFQRQFQAASAQLSAANGDEYAVEQWEHVLIRLHWMLAQVQASIQACKTA